MRLKVGCRLDYHSTYETPLILQVRLHAGLSQSIIREELILEPSVPVKEYVDHYGNFCHRLMAPEGKLAVSTQAIVDTEEFLRVDSDANFTLIQDLPDDTLIYLLPSRFCESDKLNSKAFEIVNSEMNGLPDSGNDPAMGKRPHQIRIQQKYIQHVGARYPAGATRRVPRYVAPGHCLVSQHQYSRAFCDGVFIQPRSDGSACLV